MVGGRPSRCHVRVRGAATPGRGRGRCAGVAWQVLIGRRAVSLASSGNGRRAAVNECHQGIACPTLRCVDMSGCTR